jgi:hypothetical protein
VAARKVITIPAQPAEEDERPPALKPSGAVPPLVTDMAAVGARRSRRRLCRLERHNRHVGRPAIGAARTPT